MRIPKFTSFPLGRKPISTALEPALRRALPCRDIVFSYTNPENISIVHMIANKRNVVIADPDKLKVINGEIINLKERYYCSPIIVQSECDLRNALTLEKKGKKEPIFPFVFDPRSGLFAFSEMQMDHHQLAKGFTALWTNGLTKRAPSTVMIKGITKQDHDGRIKQILVTPFNRSVPIQSSDMDSTPIHIVVEKDGVEIFRGDEIGLAPKNIYNNLMRGLINFGLGLNVLIGDSTPTDLAYASFLRNKGISTLGEMKIKLSRIR